MRKRYFEYFLQGMAKTPILINHHITQEFLRNKTIDMEKVNFTLTQVLYHFNISQTTVKHQRIQTTFRLSFNCFRRQAITDSGTKESAE